MGPMAVPSSCPLFVLKLAQAPAKRAVTPTGDETRPSFETGLLFQREFLDPNFKSEHGTQTQLKHTSQQSRSVRGVLSMEGAGCSEHLLGRRATPPRALRPYQQRWVRTQLFAYPRPLGTPGGYRVRSGHGHWPPLLVHPGGPLMERPRPGTTPAGRRLATRHGRDPGAVERTVCRLAKKTPPFFALYEVLQ